MNRLHSMPFGAELTADGVRFALWAPTAKSVELACGSRRHAMPHVGQGWYKLFDAAATAGERYGFAIDGDQQLVPDPASRFQNDDLDRRSTILDPSAYEWHDAEWAGRDWNEVVLCEVHVGTVTPEGTYAALEAKLPYYKEIGITAVELMPLAETTGLRTWGYDGVLPFAPNNAYGSPLELKRLIDTAHELGLMIFVDVVYNHFGPSGNFLHSYAGSFFTERHSTPWGAAINFDAGSAAGEVVREFFIENALYWLDEYHVDGLRFDAVHAILDEGERHFLDDLARRIRSAFPERHVHLVLENENNEAHRLTRDGARAVSFDAQWDDDYHHCWHVLLTGEDEGYYRDFGGDTVARLGRCLAEGFAYQGEHSANLKRRRGEPTEGLPPQAFVTFLQNHDQIGNRAHGDRLTSLADPGKLSIARAILYLAPQIPMIFMGDEWGATTPFQFFVNFETDAELEEAIRKGRAREFETFKAFGGDSGPAVPDPTSIETFDRSKIDWTERDAEPHAAILAETRELLAIRRREIWPLMASGFIDSHFERVGSGGLEVVWRFEAGSLVLIADFSSDDGFATSRDGDLLWTSASGQASSGPQWAASILKSPPQ